MKRIMIGAVGAACLIAPATALPHSGAVAGGCYYDEQGNAMLGSSFTYQKFPVNVSSTVRYAATFDAVLADEGQAIIRPTASGQTITIEGRRVPVAFGTHAVTVSTWWDLAGSRQRIDRSFTVTCPDNRPPVVTPPPSNPPVPTTPEIIPGPSGGPADDEVIKLPPPPRLTCAALRKVGAGVNTLRRRGCIKPPVRFLCPPSLVTKRWQEILFDRHGVKCPSRQPLVRRTPAVAG